LESLLLQARTEAVLLGHSQIGTEHLLLAVLQCVSSRAYGVLHRHGWSAEAVRRLLEKGKSGLPLPQGLSKQAKTVLLQAREETKKLSSDAVEADHLLLAMMRTQEATAVQILQKNGTDPGCVFSDLCGMMQHKQECSEQRGGTMRLLEQFCDDMIAQSEKADPVIGRQYEIDALIGVLVRKNKNNPALIGEPGVGKTAVVEGLAQRMASGTVPQLLQGKRLLRLDMASVLAGTKYRGEFEERVRDILAEIKRNGNVILFVDEMHTLVGAGSAEGAIDAANLLKPALGRAELQLIGATTLEEYRKHIEKDAALERRFRPILVKEPSRQETLDILEGLRNGLEKHHCLHITKEAMEAAVELSCRYLCDRFLPDKAVDLLDEAAAKVGCRRKIDTAEEVQRRRLHAALTAAVEENRFEQAAQYRDRLQQLSRQKTPFGRQVLDREDVALVVAQRTGIPVGKMTGSEKQRLLHLKEDLQALVCGQDHAVQMVTSAVCRGRMGLADEARPVASMLFYGPTGVGKTALCKALAQCVFGSEDAMIRLDMSEYMEKHSVSRLIGAPPGYVGYEEGGKLTEKVRRRPYCVVLLDEVEKAHRDIQGLLLQVMEDGVLTDAMGRQVNFRNTILIMTSNLGSGNTAMDTVGFLAEKESVEYTKALREYFSPEFLGRLDCVVAFKPLTEQTLHVLAEKELLAVKRRMEKAKTHLETDETTADYLVQNCRGRSGGAREIRRMIRNLIETPAAELLLSETGEFNLRTVVEDGHLQIERIS